VPVAAGDGEGVALGAWAADMPATLAPPLAEALGRALDDGAAELGLLT
jgi:hypothetical protein